MWKHVRSKTNVAIMFAQKLLESIFFIACLDFCSTLRCNNHNNRSRNARHDDGYSDDADVGNTENSRVRLADPFANMCTNIMKTNGEDVDKS